MRLTRHRGSGGPDAALRDAVPPYPSKPDQMPAAPGDPPTGQVGRGSLRLVRMRLALALLAAGVVPIALAAPVMVRVGQEMQARVGPAESSAAAARLGGELDAVRERLLAARTSSAVVAAVAGKSGTSAKAVAALDRVAAADPAVVTGVWVLDGSADGLVASRLPGRGASADPLPVGDARAAVVGALNLPDGPATWVEVVDRAAGADLYLAAPVGADGAASARTAVVLVRMSAPDLLAQVQTGLGGSVVAFVGHGSSPTVLEPASGARDTAPGGRVPIDVPGFEDWSIAVRSLPIQLDLPIQMLLLAFLLGSAVITIVWWLARQVMRPAEQLERASTRLGELYETARSDALEDSLTGLGNHRAFMEEFDRQLEQSRRYGAPMTLLLLDLDDFKLVNDSAGHAVGDQMLVETGRLLRSTVRRSDRPFRIGGDEFAVLMPHTSADMAEIVGRRLLAACTEPRPASAFPRPYAFSAGISAAPEFSTSRSELFAQADAALYEAKRHGRTTVSIFDPERARPTVDQQARSELSARVARVVSVGAIRAVYQPIVDLQTGRVVGFEGLVRPAPDSGFADAGTLFAAAEASGRTFELDRACLEAVVRGSRQLGPDQTLSINMSPRSLEAPEFNAGSLLGLLAHNGIDPRRVTLELTEREAVEDIDRLRSVIASCQAAGLRIAADDVGAGNAGLRLLSQIHFDIVKIDLSLVQAGEVSDSSLAVVRALTELAQRWGAMVVAEGVETAGQLRVVQELGMSAAQGYLLGRPSDVPAVRFVDLGALLAQGDAEGPAVFRGRSAMPVAG